MSESNHRFVALFAVAAGLMLVLIACGSKVELPQTEAAATAYVKSKVLASIRAHPGSNRMDRMDVLCPRFMNHAYWWALRDRDGGWEVGASTGEAPLTLIGDLQALKRYQEISNSDSKWVIQDDGTVQLVGFPRDWGISACSGVDP